MRAARAMGTRLIVALLVIVLSTVAMAQTEAAWSLDRNTSQGSVGGRNLQVSLHTDAAQPARVSLQVDAWNGEASFGIQLTNAEEATGLSLHNLGSSEQPDIALSSDDSSHRIYLRADDNLEWYLVLDTPPGRTRFAYALHTDNVRFLYQGELSDAEIATGAQRPDSVVGSYAVYHAHARGNYELADGSGRSYRTGKICHIYRPKAWDNAGDTVWCTLSIDEDSLIVTVPETFLAKAVYPVTIDPTFGRTDMGGSNVSLPTDMAGANVIDTYTAAAGDVIVSYHFSCYTYNIARTIEMAAYSMSGGAPQARLATGVEIAVQNNSPPQWYTSTTVNHPLTAGTQYCLAAGAVSGANVRAQYDTETGGRVSDNTAAGALPAVWTTTDSDDRRMSWYATYTQGAPDEEITVRRRRAGLQ
ncbi:hypothetical protein GF420_07865 [candidate division GN15 bacterium]|nr:hypothetical protein [candidate division GN15 bacterium]